MGHNLEKYYIGDSAWNRFVEIFRDDWDQCVFKDEIVNKLNGFVDISIVVCGQLGDQATSWIEKKIPVLDDLTPIDCTRSKIGEKVERSSDENAMIFNSLALEK